MVGVNTLLEAFKRGTDTTQATVTTTTLTGGQTHDIDLASDDEKVDSISFSPSSATPPQEAKILLVRPIVVSGSTDTDFFIYESTDRNDVDEVVRIETLSVNDNVDTFQPGSGTGVDFQNQEGNNSIHLRFTENSTTDSQYKIRLRWFDTTSDV